MPGTRRPVCQAFAMAEGMQPVEWDGRRAVVKFPGHVNGSNAAGIRDQLLAVFDIGAAVVIADMSATMSCDQAGLDAVSLACQQAAIRQAELRLVVTGQSVRRLLIARGIDRLVAVYPSLASAAAGRPVPVDPASPPAAPEWPPDPADGPGPRPLTAAMLRQVLDALSDGIVLTDEAGLIVLASRKAAEMFGYQPDELTGQPVETLVPAALRDTHRRDRAAYAAKPVNRPMADRARLAGLGKDGTTIPVTITLSPVPVVGGHLVLAVVRDATHEHGQNELTVFFGAVLTQQARHTAELLDRIVTGLFHVGISLNRAADQPSELARERISEALRRLDDLIHEVRDHVFRSRHPGDGEPPW